MASPTNVAPEDAGSELAKRAEPEEASQPADEQQSMRLVEASTDAPEEAMTTESVLSQLVSEDMASLRSARALRHFFAEHLFRLGAKGNSEVLSILIAIVKKSVFHLELARGLLIPCIQHLLRDAAPQQQQQQQLSEEHSSLTKHFLREWINLLIAHSCDVDELSTLIAYSEHDPSLLQFVKQANLKQRNRPPAFFAFPGSRGSMMSLAPFQRWPSQLGWSFSTWFYLEPKPCAQPYLYNFKTGKSGLGYSAHFTGNCLVLTSIKVKGKGVQHCVAYEFPSYKWTHCAITYHNKWRASEIKVYVNGQLSANIEMAWQVQTTEPYDKCSIGGSASIGASSDRAAGELNCFCGQMASVYLFNEGLSPAQICAIHRLGSSYMGQFKYSNETNFNLPPQISKVIYEDKLASSLFCLYTPAAVDSGTLCIQLAPLKSSTSSSAQNYFISAPHAALLGQTKAISTQSICSTLQSLGCSRSLFPLLEIYVSKGDSEAATSLIGFLCDLLESSPQWFANEIVQNNGFVLVACALSTNSRLLITDKLLDIFLSLTRTSLTTSTTVADSLLLKHLMDNILFNPTLWIYADTKLQIKLYTYLATEFLHGTRQTLNKYTASSNDSSNPYLSYNPTTNAIAHQSLIDDQSKISGYDCPVVTDVLFGEVRRVSTVLQSLHALKYFYWVSEEKNINQKCRNHKLRPSREDLVIIRSHILEFVRDLVKRANSTPLDEIQGILNYLSSCTQPDNILDVLGTLVSLLKDLPSRIVTALEQKQGVKVIFTLIGSKSEQIRIQSLRLLSLFLSRCTHKRKLDIMNPNNLFTLLSDKLRPYKPLSLETYETLLNIVIEHDSVQNAPISGSKELKKKRIENSMVVRVIATLLHEQKDCNYARASKDVKPSKETDIKLLFINDLWNLIVNNKENRRIILQMSVWQHWLINLIDSTIDDSQLVRDQVLSIFRILLYHAIHYEYGGWRVWIDTLAIIHTKVSYDVFCRQLNADLSSPISSDLKDMRLENSSPTPKLEEIKKETSQKVTNISEATQDEVDARMESNEVAADESQTQVPVSSISERIPRVSSGINMDANTNEDPDKGITGQQSGESELTQIKEEEMEESRQKELSGDTVDVAPSRIYRKLSISEETEQQEDVNQDGLESPADNELIRQASLTSIPLEENSIESINLDGSSNKEDDVEEVKNLSPEMEQNDTFQSENIEDHEPVLVQSQKVTASPAFRIPEFKWSGILIKLLNDLLFSIECDLYQWRCSAKCSNLDQPPFTPKSSSNVQSNSNQGSLTKSSATQSSGTHPIETILQRPDHQTYLVNLIHFVSQLADNIVIAAGGLLPLLADATGGGRAPSVGANVDSKSNTCEGLTMPQANSLLYRLVNMVDIVIFAASHINLTELEADKNTTTGSILRQCLRLACTVTVKNCLVVRSIHNKILELGLDSDYTISPNDFPKEMFDSYQGCSLLSANGLFEHSALTIETSDLVSNIEFSPHQTPNTGMMPSLLPFQSAPIKDANKLLQSIDIHRIQACIYHDMSTESRQSQFLALSSLYFISVLMVSKYRDIIEPKHKSSQKDKQNSIPAGSSTSINPANQSKNSISSIEANLLSFGQIQPTVPDSSSSTTTLTHLLTTKLENTLNTVCPLLQAIMCDFRVFLSKTLIGSHGQDLVLKETERTFKRTNASPVELVMLLCSQEWQNTLQKNAGLAFIELINEGRVLSHGMKDHIVRVAMEAEFIMSRLRADDVAKHEQFISSCSETFSARLHEEVLINSLITSAMRRDFVIHSKFKESMQKQSQRQYKLDIWEDDDRRRRRFVIDSWDDSEQCFYPSQLNEAQQPVKSDTREVLDMHQTIELTGFDNACSSAAAGGVDTVECEAMADEDCDDDESDDNNNNDSNSPYSDNEQAKEGPHMKGKEENFIEELETADEKRSKSRILNKTAANKLRSPGAGIHELDEEIKRDYDECDSVNDFTGSVVFAAECSLIWNIYAIPGILQLTTYELYFEPNQNISDRIDSLKKKSSTGSIDLDDEDEAQNKEELSGFGGQQHALSRKIDLKVLRYCDFLTCNGKIPLLDIRAIFSRNYLFQPHALEIFLSHRTSVMFAFADYDTVKRVVKHLPPVGVGIKYGIPQSRRASLMAPKQLFAASNMTQKWKRREIGNFQYLMFLNTVAGRTYQDLNQYPVFPWILTNYDSEELDLNLPSNFRDLSKPVGALNGKRRAEFIKRYENWDNPKVPAFHYGTHYSTSEFTLGWLCRLRGAYNSAYLALQDGEYEPESRLFRSIGDAWVSSLVGDQQNVKELIPEFFYLPEMFRSSLGIPEVEYPRWAKNAEHFVRTHRLALESELVSCQLHQWIDLIFGYKQRGPEAVNAVNTFYYLTYQGSVNLNLIQDPGLRDALETQIKHFGQTPSQLTTDPHPPRFSALHVSPMVFSSGSVEELNKVIKYPFKTSIMYISSCIEGGFVSDSSTDHSSDVQAGNKNSTVNLVPSSILTITSNNQYQIHKWRPNDLSNQPLTIDPQLEQAGSGSSRRQLIDVDDLCPAVQLKTNPVGDIVDEVQWCCTHYVVTLDSRYIIMASFYDNSFRVFSTENGKLCQVIYGHKAPITCMARSDGNAVADFYVATGSQDCSLLLWTWNDKYAQVEGSGVSVAHNPLPKLTISGHRTPVLSAVICAELGLIISGSKNLILVHTTTTGENLLEIDVNLARLQAEAAGPAVGSTCGPGFSRVSANKGNSGEPISTRPSIENKQKTILEASMLGSSGAEINSSTTTTPAGAAAAAEPSSANSSAKLNKAAQVQLKDLCHTPGDYYITNLQVARELGFIVCLGLPLPRKKAASSRQTTTTDAGPASECPAAETTAAAPALLMTFNLKGQLMESTTVGQLTSGLRLGDVSLLRSTRDGEHTLLNDSPSSLKVYRTFDLHPIYAYNLNDLPGELEAEQARIRSLALIEQKYILVGLESGRIVVYNADLANAG